jgi:branched-chain amino acid transport system ATP-binding protein
MADGIRKVPERDGCTLVVVDHWIGFVSALCSTIAALNFGLVLATGLSAEVLAYPRSRC